MAAPLILLLSIVAAISLHLFDNVSQNILQGTSRSSSEFLLSVSFDLLLLPSHCWSPNVFHAKNVYESECRSFSWHLIRVFQLLVLLCEDIERNPGSTSNPFYVDCERLSPLPTSSSSSNSCKSLFPALGLRYYILMSGAFISLFMISEKLSTNVNLMLWL